jgi:hypothetical protein
MMKVNNVSLKC